MKELLVSQIVPILVAGIVALIGSVIKAVGDAIIAYIEAKKEEVIKKVGAEKYRAEKEIAMDVWKIVEEHFRINEIIEDKIEKMNKKAAMFKDLILQKVPGITEEQIEFLRQTIAGEINKGKAVLTLGADKLPPPSEEIPSEPN